MLRNRSRSSPPGRALRGAAAAILFLLTGALAAEAAWHDPSWSYRKKITIDNTKVAATLTDFPVLISLASDTDLATHARADGFDLLFTSDDEVTQLDHEIERFVSGTGELVAWVRIPSLSSSADTDVYLYYGHSTSPDQQNVTGVWSANYAGVWHWDDDFLDSSPSGYHGTNVGSSDAAGWIADGQDFDGSNDYVDLTVINPRTYDDFTLSAWYRSADTSVSDDEYIYMHYGTAFSNELVFGPTDDTADRLRLGIYFGGNWYAYYSTTDVVDQQWHHLAAVRGGGRLKLFVDGVKERDVADPEAGNSLVLNTTGPFSGDDPGNTEQVDGTVDELRLSSVGRSDAWILTTFNNQDDPGSFFSLGPAAAGGSSISGVVFEDADFAGTASDWDGGVADAGLDSVDVELYDATDAYVASVATSAGGAYSFTGLADGTYKVRARTATIGDVDTPPAGGLNASVPGTWPYPVPEMTWGAGAPRYGGADPTADDRDTADNAGPGDAYASVTISGSDATGAHLGFAYNLIVNVEDDGAADNTASDPGSLRQFLKNANAIGPAAGTTASSSQFRMQVAANQTSGADTWWRITPSVALPAISDSLTTLDGTTQTTNGGDTNSLGPEIEIDGAALDANGIALAAASNTVRGLVVGGFSGSFRAGIRVSGAAATGNTVAGNYVGTGHSGTATNPNYYGIYIGVGAQSNTIGGSSPSDRNVISGNAEEGIAINGTGTDLNVIRGNFIGTNALGTAGLGNADDGIAILSGARDNTIGGTTAADRNIISANSLQGVSVSGAHDNLIRGNYIGTDVTGMVRVPNLRGVWLSSAATGNVIGGPTAGHRNLISGNNFRGIVIGNAGTADNVVQGNWIGTDTTGVASLFNIGPGIEIQFSAVNTTIGGLAAGEGNVIAFNTGDGIYLSTSATDGHVIAGNSIFSNTGLGVDLEPDGVGAGGGANNDHAPPVIGSLTPAGADFTVVATCAAGDTVDFFRVTNASAPVVSADGTGAGEGYLYLGSCVDGGSATGPHIAAAADADPASGSVQAVLLASGVTSGDVLSATASNTTDGTSEFATNVTATGTYTISGVVFEDADFAGTASDWDGGVTDAGLDSVDVELYDAADTFVAGVTTSAGGAYSFPGLADGTYKVRARSSTIGDADTPPAAGTHGTVPGTWPYPLPEMTWANAAAIGGQDPVIDDTATASNAGPGDTYAAVSVSGADVTGVNLGFAYDVVTNTLDDSASGSTRSAQGSFRQFLKNSNGIVGTDSTWFAIPTSDPGYNVAGHGEYVIAATSEFPDVADPAVIDGSTQPGYASAPLVQLDGNATVAGEDGLTIVAGSSVVRALVINRFDNDGIRLTSAGGNVIEGCYLGTDPAGTTARPNGDDGVQIESDANTIGGLTALARNLISGNGDVGIKVTGTGNTIIGNTIGADINRTAAMPNGRNGLHMVDTSANNVIGGTIPGAANVIAGNDDSGVYFRGAASTGNRVEGNFIGVSDDGLTPIPNGEAGIAIADSSASNTIGGSASGAGNVIAYNTLMGVHVSHALADANRLLGNSIHSNGGLGIELVSGANNDKAAPTLTTVYSTGPDFTAIATVAATDTVEFFRVDNAASPVVTADGTGAGEGYLYLGRCVDGGTASGPHISAVADADPAAGTLQVTLLASGMTAANAVTATATDTTDGTSPFAANLTPVAGPTADLSLTKTVDDATPVVGTNIVFTVVVDNAGPVGATGVAVTDSLPAGYSHVSDDGGGAYDPNSGIWTVGSLASGAADTLNITVRVKGSGPWDNTAEVTAADQTDPDSTPGNANAAEDDQATVSVTPNQLKITKKAFLTDGTPLASGSVAPKGALIKYVLYVNNPGGTVVDVSLQDVLDPGFVYQAGSLRYDDSLGNCATGTCTPAEEAAIFAAVDAGTPATETTGDDIASYAAGTLDVGDASAANTQLNVGPSRVWAAIFTVKIN